MRRGKPNVKNRGKRNGNAKLTASEVRRMRRMYASGEYYQSALAEYFGVTQVTVSRIINGRLWAHLR